jgi:glycosyltransferase involved in cell wall biosynthesis
MNVLIDATPIRRNKAGVGVYAKSLIEELIRIPDGPQVFILAQNDDPELDFCDHANVTMIRVPAKLFRKLLLRFLLEQAVLPFLLLRYRIDVLHSLHYSFPLVRFGTRQVVTLHDMTFFDMPQVHVPVKVFYFRAFIRAAVRFADKIIFVSHSTMRDCVRRLGPVRDRGEVIHLGKSEAFSPDFDMSGMRRLREKYGLHGEYVLYVGTIEPRKNLARLVSAFGEVSGRYPGLLLVIAGKKGWMYEDLMEAVRNTRLEPRVIFTGFVSESEKPLLIVSAKVFAYPSLYEGFGIPVLEALACGIPTLTSRLSSMPEVAGDAALLVDPTNVAELSLALDRLLSDGALREKLKQKALLQAAKFTWAKTAAMTLRVYESCCR